MPFAGYKSFADCVTKNQDKDNPEAYCAVIMRKVEGETQEDVPPEAWQDLETLEDYYMKKAFLALQAAIHAHDSEPLNYTTMEKLEDEMLKQALSLLRMAYEYHKKEAGIYEGHYQNQDANIDLINHVISRYNQLKNRGMPDLEIQRVILSELAYGINFGDPWPPRLTGGYDTVDHIFPELIPASAFPPKLEVEEQVAIPSSLSGISVGAKRPTSQQYLGTAANTIGPPEIHNEPALNKRQIPEESFFPYIQNSAKDGEFANNYKSLIPVQEQVVPNYARYQYNGHDQGELCWDFDGKIFDLNKIDGRPVIPSEQRGYTTQHPNCYSDDTEVYTDTGWKFFKDLDKSELILSINPHTHDLEFQKPIRYVAYHYQGQMIELKNQWNNLCVTPDHNMVISTHTTPHLYFRKAKDLQKSHTIYRSSKWRGQDLFSIKINNLEIPIETFCKFMGYWLSEGSVTKRTQHQYQIAISQHKQENLQQIFNDISYLPTKICKGQTQLYIFNESLGSYLHQFGKSFDKYVPQSIKNLSPRLIRIFLDAYLLGDGHIRKPRTKLGINFSEERTYFTSSKRLADDIGELILKIGKVPSFHLQKTKGKVNKFKNGTYQIKTDVWCIRETNSHYSTMRRMKTNKINYDDTVYCVELPKYHTLYVRRNGQCSWCGNCKCTWITIDPIIAANIEPSKLYGDELSHVSHVNRIVGQKAYHGSLHILNSDGSVSDQTIDWNPRKISETVGELKSQFKWLSPEYLQRVGQIHLPGKFLLIRAAGEATTDHRIEGEPYERFLSGQELVAMARTAIGKGMDINHEPAYRTPAFVMDAEGDPERKEIQMLVYESDPEVLQAIKNNIITAVSINGGPPRQEDVECSDRCYLVPKGVVLGEADGIALTYVVTDPRGMNWHGQWIQPAEPGVKNTRLEPLT